MVNECGGNASHAQLHRHRKTQYTAVACGLGLCGIPRPTGSLLACRLLNNFFGILVNCIHDHGGDVMRFAGDSVIALFPTRDPSCDSQTSLPGREGADACFRALQCSAKILGLTNTAVGGGNLLSEGTHNPSDITGNIFNIKVTSLPPETSV